MNWLKLHHDLRTDRKVATLLDDEFRTFINLLILASEQEENRGEVRGLDDDLLALEVCNGDTGLLERTLGQLQRLRIVSVGQQGVTRYIAFLHFDERQARKPSDDPARVLDRVHKHRQAKRNASYQEGNAGVTRYTAPVTPRNAHRTEQSRVETEQNRTDHSPAESGALAPPERDAPLAVATGRKPDPLWDAFKVVWPQGPRTDSERGRWNKAAQELRDGGVTPQEIVTAAAHWPNVMGAATMTPMALASNLGMLLEGPQVNGRSGGTVQERRQRVTQTATVGPDARAVIEQKRAQRALARGNT